MKTITVNGKTIKTNLHESYSYWSGNDMPKTLRYRPLRFRESTEEAFNELVNAGYTYITFRYTTTRVRGYHNVYVFYR